MNKRIRIKKQKQFIKLMLQIQQIELQAIQITMAFKELVYKSNNIEKLYKGGIILPQNAICTFEHVDSKETTFPLSEEMVNKIKESIIVLKRN